MPFHYKVNQDVVKQLLTKGHTYRYIGEKVGCSYERIRQFAGRWKLFPHHVRKLMKAKEDYIKNQERQLKFGDKEHTPRDLYIAQRKKFYGKKANCKRAGCVWEIQFGKLTWPTHCPILGLELNYFANVTSENSPSFDKIDPSKGYTNENIHIISWRANRIKNDGTAEEHDKIAKYLYTLDLS